MIAFQGVDLRSVHFLSFPTANESLIDWLIDWLIKFQGVDLRSVHFLSFPTPNESLIDAEIESAVAKMQTVIELGRVIRDRNTMPIKYPLKQVIVVMETAEALKDVQVSRADI